VLEKIGELDRDAEVRDIRESLGAETRQGSEPLFIRKYRLPIFLAVSIGMFNQLSGINAILDYLNGIFERAGFSKVSSDPQAVAIGSTNLLFTIIAISIIDRVGRKKLLLTGAAGTAACLAGVAAVFASGSHGEMLVWLLVGFIAFFAFSQGAVIWVCISDVFPNLVRAKGQSLGGCTHWIMNALISGVSHPASPVLKPETPMELNGGLMPAAAPFSDGVWYDRKDKLYKLWYQARYDDGFAYAFSEDGLHWKRPDLDILPGTNRILKPTPGYMRNGCTIWLDHEAADPNQRYKFFGYFRAGTGSWPRKRSEPPPDPLEMSHLRTSPDGIHWSEPVLGGPRGDNSGMFYNPFRKMWTFSIRETMRKYGRIRSYREHPDFLTSRWEKKDVHPWMWCDELDLPDPDLGYVPELYKVDCVAHESRMIAFLGIYKGPPNEIAVVHRGFPKTNDLEVAFSRDGLAWERPDRTPFLACSRRPGTWNRGYLHAASGLFLVVGTADLLHRILRHLAEERHGTVRRVEHRPGDAAARRLCVDERPGRGDANGRAADSRNADDTDGDVLRAPPVREREGEGRRAAGGSARPGRASDRALHAGQLRARDVRFDEAAVVWKHGGDLRGLAGKPVRLRFEMTSGELDSYWVSRDESGASRGYVAAGGPGFTGSTDTTGA